jgi:adenylate cyclase
MSQEPVFVAILFADIAKSTQLYETLGDKLAQKAIASSLGRLEDVTQAFAGTVIKTIGDEIMCTFPSAQEAVDAAREMHLSMEQMRFRAASDIPPPNLYVGLQYGPVIHDGGDVFGEAVNVAARMREHAKPRQIVTTGETIARLPESYREKCHCIEKTPIKGICGELDIFEVIWEEEDVTVMVDEQLAGIKPKTRLELRVGSTTTRVDEHRPAVSLGRQLHNDVVVNDGMVSRTHARVEYRRGKFFLMDQSTNGTYLETQGKKNIHIKGEETQLAGYGHISLGKEIEPSDAFIISYIVRK